MPSVGGEMQHFVGMLVGLFLFFARSFYFILLWGKRNSLSYIRGKKCAGVFQGFQSKTNAAA